MVKAWSGRALRAVALAGLSACQTPCTPGRPPKSDTQAPGLAVDQQPFVELSLPTDSREGHSPPPSLPIRGWRADPDAEASRWHAELPVRPRALFFHRPPPDLALLDEAGVPVVAATAEEPEGWRVAPPFVLLEREQGSAPSGLTLQTGRAVEREARLNWRMSRLSDPADFVRFNAQVGPTTRAGLLLPAPSHAAVQVQVPASAELHFTATILPPELRDLPSGDGATLQVEVQAGSDRTILWSAALTEGEHRPVRLDLDRWVGQTVRIRFRSEAGSNNRYDYVFVGDPQIAPRRRSPRRVVLAFIDTVRADRTSAYGFHEPTTPWLAEVARDGTRFSRALSVSPWTLPSYRSAMTGRVPRAWGDGPTLPERLRARGWATGMIAGNVYLSTNFDGDRGWGMHRVVAFPSATDQVTHAKAWLEQHQGRDALLLLHFMDPHLPYREPSPFREAFADAAPSGWDEPFSRPQVLTRDPDPEERRWIERRYLNNLLYVDTALRELDAHLEPDDLLVVFSDHGEEFWDHGGFEHGHSLHDELLHVPLVFRGPGIPKATSEAPASLLDLTPTVLGWAGVPLDERGGGRDLFAGAPSSDSEPRSLPIGHPLYGYERWGVARGDAVYRTHAGDEQVVADRPNALPTDDLAGWRDALGHAHRATAHRALRIAVKQVRTPTEAPLTIRVTAPVTFVRAWPGDAPLGGDLLPAPTLEDGVSLSIPAGWRGMHEVYILADQPVRADTLQVFVGRDDEHGGGAKSELHPGSGEPPSWTTGRRPDGTRWTVGPGVAVIPADPGTLIHGFDAELAEMLSAAGYTVGPAADAQPER